MRDAMIDTQQYVTQPMPGFRFEMVHGEPPRLTNGELAASARREGSAGAWVAGGSSGISS